MLLKMANYAYEDRAQEAVHGGGVALNSVANGRILHETPFEEVCIQPAPGIPVGRWGQPFTCITSSWVNPGNS